MEKHLTPFQQKLVDDLTNEFTKLNVKPTVNNVNRFTFATISECNREEEHFKNTIIEHNRIMFDLFIKQFNDDIKAFKKEFGKVIDIQIGHTHFGSGTAISNGEKLFTEVNNKQPLYDNRSYEMRLFLVSKTKPYWGEGRYNYCNGKMYLMLYVDFKRERVSHKLESGKVVDGYKVIGLQYSTSDYLRKSNDSAAASTLNELIQTTKLIQTKIVELANLQNV